MIVLALRIVAIFVICSFVSTFTFTLPLGYLKNKNVYISPRVMECSTTTARNIQRTSYICYAASLSENGEEKSSKKKPRKTDDSNEMTYLELDLTLEDDEDQVEDYDSDIIPGMRPKHSMNDKEWMFFDVAKVNVKGGEGGDGCMAMRREYCIEHGGPSGGNGGCGGSIFFQCDNTLNTLSALRRKVHHRGGDGTNGRGDSRHGQKGADIIIPVPPGTIVRDQYGALAGELNHDGQRMLVAKGGRGGRGNEYFKTSRMNAPVFAERGEPGAERWLNVELKLIADVGLVGVPNAGKSTLLAASSNAKPKIADYPFTTVVPNLGVCDVDLNTDGSNDGSSLVLADIPGLLEGAHEGVGLGMAFLRHIQRCRLLVHVIRGDSEDPIGDFIAINQELELYNPALAKKIQVVVVNKVDIPAVREQFPSLRKQIRDLCGHTRIVAISAATGEGVKELMSRVRKVVSTMPRQSDLELFTEEENRVSFEEEEDEKFEIFSDENFPGQYRVVGKKIEKVVVMTNWDYYESIQRFQRILEAEGISDALKKAGAQQGDLVMIGEWDFNYWERKNRWVAELGLENINPRKRYVNYEDEEIKDSEPINSYNSE